jgi:hypothetical protein
MSADPLAVRLAITKAMADELNDYLMGNTLYRRMLVDTPAGSEPVVMTLGALLENLGVLEGYERSMDEVQRGQLASIRDAIARARRTFPEAWQALLRRELKALLDSRKWYLDDLAQGKAEPEPKGPEVQQRARIDLILRELGTGGSVDEERRRLSDMDARERGNL